MGDSQCGLCLSCGGPFMPEIDDIDFFNRQGNLSLLFLDTEFKNSPDVRRIYEKPKLIGKRHRAHVFHQSHHATAVNYMCNMHEDDGDVGYGVVAPGLNTRVPDQKNAPLLYFHAPTSKGDKKGRAAFWFRPLQAERLDMRPLLKVILNASGLPGAGPIEQNLEQTFTTCDKCNYLMTQQADFRFLLGFNAAGVRNTRGKIIQGRPIQQYGMKPTTPLPDAFGNWRFLAPPANVVDRPHFNDEDSEASHVGYYLHMCMPYKPDRHTHDIFTRRIANDEMRVSARSLYIEQCWIILEIACLALAVEEGRVSTGEGKLSHGMHQHLGALDLYVSFFLWRLIQFEHGNRVSAVLDFVQWHQKFYWDAVDCKGLFAGGLRHDIIGRQVFGSTDQPARRLVETICKGLVFLYKVKLRHLVRLVAGYDMIPPAVKDYFVPLNTVRALKIRSIQLATDDFHAAMGKFGVNAMFFRLHRLCMGYPDSIKRQLLDFRVSTQWLEVERVRLSNKGLTARAAYNQYFMCTLLDAPYELPESKEDVDAVFAMHDFCSRWASVLALDHIGAFRTIKEELDVPTV